MTFCHQVREPVHLVRIWLCSATGNIEFSWWKQLILIHSWRHTKLQKQKYSSLTNSLITQTKSRTQNFPRVTPSTVNFAALTLLKPITRTMLTHWKKTLTKELAVIKLKLSRAHLTGIENYQYLQQLWKLEQVSSFKKFLRWYNSKNIFPILEQCKKWLHLTTTKISIWQNWLHITTRGQHLSKQIYRYKILFLHGGSQRPVGENSRRFC